MALLKKIKAGTLVETIVASVLLVLIFGIASMVVSNVLKSNLLHNRLMVLYEIEKLEYRYLNDDLVLPYTESFQFFEVEVSEIEGAVSFEAYTLAEHRLLQVVSLKKKK